MFFLYVYFIKLFKDHFLDNGKIVKNLSNVKQIYVFCILNIYKKRKTDMQYTISHLKIFHSSATHSIDYDLLGYGYELCQVTICK